MVDVDVRWGGAIALAVVISGGCGGDGDPSPQDCATEARCGDTESSGSSGEPDPSAGPGPGSGSTTMSDPDDSGSGSGTDSESDSGSGSDTGEPPEEDPNAPPTEGFFLLLGSDASPGTPDAPPACLYRYDAERAPTVLACPEDDPSEPRRWIRVSEPRDGWVWFVQEIEVLDIYPLQVWRVPIDGGTPEDAEMVWQFDGDTNGGPQREITGLVPLPSGAGVLSRHTEPWDTEAYDELMFIDAEGEVGEDLLPDRPRKRLIDRFDSGELLVHDADTGELLALAPEGGAPTVLTPGISTQDEPLSGYLVPRMAPDGERVLFTTDGGVGVATLDGVALMNGAVPFGGYLLGWAGDGGVLVWDGLVLRRWDGRDGADAAPLPAQPDGMQPIYVARPAGASTAFRLTSDDGLRAMTWLHAGAFTGACGDVGQLDALGAVYETEQAIVVFSDADDDSPTFAHVFSCRPGGEAADLLEDHGLWGHVVP